MLVLPYMEVKSPYTVINEIVFDRLSRCWGNGEWYSLEFKYLRNPTLNLLAITREKKDSYFQA